jgi:cytochrome c
MRGRAVFRRAAVALLLAAAACGRGDMAEQGAGSVWDAERSPSLPAQLGLGRAPSAAEIAAIDISVDPSGAGLPVGSGTAASGAPVFARRCASCHGAGGEGIGANPRLVGREPRNGFPFGRDPRLVHTVGNYWPYATTLYDYIHRAMPLDAPGSLTPSEVYGLVAFLLARNEVIAPDAVIDAHTLPEVKMPARGRFVRDDRTGGAGFR